MPRGFAASTLVLSIAMIWMAHIGIDRALLSGIWLHPSRPDREGDGQDDL